MIYVVEGLDRCGKSSFIDVLRSHIKNPKILVIHSGKPPKDVDPKEWSIEYYDFLISKSLEMSFFGYDIILDRAWFGETVYGPIYRNTNIRLDRLEHEIFDYKDNFRLFMFIDSPENLLNREDGLSFSININDKQNEIDSFVKSFNDTKLSNKILIDWNHQKFTKEFLNQLAKEATL